MTNITTMNHSHQLYRTEDDHNLCLCSAREFAVLPFWEGNRLVKGEHVEDISKSLEGDILKLQKTLFRAIGIVSEEGEVQWYIFDGQHRSSVLREYFDIHPEANMNILVMWKMYDAKQTAQIHKDFLDCNRASPIEWTVDPHMMANAYIDALLLKFHGPPSSPLKKSKRIERCYFRAGKTKKPYMSVEKVREDILKKYTAVGWTRSAEEFAEQAFQMNEKLLEILSAKEKRSSIETSMLELGFALASVDSFIWM